jgi:hypothetical protein
VGDTHSDENDRRCLCHKTVELEKSGVFVLVLVDIDVQLLNALNSEFFVRQGQHVGVGRKLVGIVYNGWRECRGE